MRSIQGLLALILFALLAAPIAAQQSFPAFPIERIEVRGARFASPAVVERESLLMEGVSYTEPQLRGAMSRVNRLPFVLDSSFALEKGTERGQYVLVITIVETKPVFAEALFGVQWHESERQSGESFRSGIRWFLGSSSLVHVATDFEENYETGITQYNLFGRPGFVALLVRFTTDNESEFTLIDPTGAPTRVQVSSDPSLELKFGFPIFGNHSLAGSWGRNSDDRRVVSDPSARLESRSERAELAWVYDTTDDPILPTAGTLWRSGFGYAESRVDPDGERVGFGSDVSNEAVFTSVVQYRPVTNRASVLYGISGGWTDTGFADAFDSGPQRTDTLSVRPEIGLTSSLWSDRLTRKYGDLRLDARATYLVLDRELGDSRFFSLTGAIVQRNVWGTLRLVMSYSDSELRR